VSWRNPDFADSLDGRGNWGKVNTVAPRLPPVENEPGIATREPKRAELRTGWTCFGKSTGVGVQSGLRLRTFWPRPESNASKRLQVTDKNNVRRKGMGPTGPHQYVDPRGHECATSNSSDDSDQPSSLQFLIWNDSRLACALRTSLEAWVIVPKCICTRVLGEKKGG
jgi:hypothetical protein